MRKWIIFTIIYVLFVALSFGICFDYVVKMSRLKNQQVGSDKQVEREDFDDLTEGYYSITYNLDGGVVENNPDKYNLFTETFTLNNPKKADGYKFIGWTSETLTEPSLTVTIGQGSAGNIEFTANYELLIAPPTITIADNIITRNVVEKADYYELCVNGDLAYYRIDGFDINVLDYLVSFVGGQNEFKLRAVMIDEDGEKISSAWSNTVYYEYVKQLEAPVLLSLENNILTWSWTPNDEFNGQQSFTICINNHRISTSYRETFNGEVCQFDFTMYKSNSYFDEGQVSITVYANHDGGSYVDSEQSNSIDITCEYFDDIVSTTVFSCPNCGYNSTYFIECPECGSEITFTWAKVPNADKYLITVSDFDNQNIKVAKYYTDNNNRTFKYSDFISEYETGHTYIFAVMPVSNDIRYIYYSVGFPNLKSYTHG